MPAVPFEDKGALGWGFQNGCTRRNQVYEFVGRYNFGVFARMGLLVAEKLPAAVG